MTDAVHHRANVADTAGSAGRGLVVNDHHGLEHVRCVPRQSRFDLSRVGTAAPIAGNELDVDAPARGHLPPQGGEVTGFHHQHLVARRQRVDDGSLPGAGARRRENHHRPRGLKNLLAALQNRSPELAELGAAVIDDRHVHGPENAVGYWGSAPEFAENAVLIRMMISNLSHLDT